jgi:D-xylose 1-dehydrogenase (NADP+, D-xylono-1,5-lactone-forming)
MLCKDEMKLALLGASRIAQRILPAIRSVEGVDVVSVGATTSGRAQEFAEKNEVGRFGSYEQVLHDCDAVYISVLNADHFSLARQALMSGKHVLSEKPLTLSQREATELFHLAAQNRLVLMEGFMYRFHPQVTRLHRLLKEGAVGNIKRVRASFCFELGTAGLARQTRKAGGGALADVGCYLIDFVNSLAPDLETPEAQVRATFGEGAAREIETRAEVRLQYRSGFEAQLDCAIDLFSVNAWEVMGDQGSVIALRFNPHGNEAAPLFVLGAGGKAPVQILEPVNGGPLEQFRREFQNFSAVIRGEEKPFITSAESIRNAALLERTRALT